MQNMSICIILDEIKKVKMQKFKRIESKTTRNWNKLYVYCFFFNFVLLLLLRLLFFFVTLYSSLFYSEISTFCYALLFKNANYNLKNRIKNNFEFNESVLHTFF